VSQEDGATDKDPIPKESIRGSIEQSIKRLGTTPDLFLIHNPFVPKPGELVDAWKVFEQLKDEGVLKCKFNMCLTSRTIDAKF
jgi:diketogulonate reductase-like aldo/keto reductase